MMRNTPHAFVGSVMFLLDGPVPPEVVEAVRAEIGRRPGISRCEVDAAAGTLLVTSDVPADRADLMAVLERIGCPVRA